MSGADRPALTFLGGVGTVTGSKHLLDTGRSRVLLDCGLFQGLSSLRRRNWAPPPVDWHTVDAVVITHAHLDHCGYLPMLAKHGWDGPVYVTDGTARLAEIVLTDSAHLQEEDARFADSAGWSKHRPALPLYDARDAARACDLFRSVRHGESVPVTDDVTLTFGRAGHILGSSWAQLTVAASAGSRSVVISGDLGREGTRCCGPRNSGRTAMCCCSNPPTGIGCAATWTRCRISQRASRAPPSAAAACWCRRSRWTARRCCWRR